MFMRRISVVVCVCAVLTAAAVSQTSAGVLKGEELKKAVPAGFFFGGQAAPTQMRNSAGLRTAQGKLVLAGLVDTTGYATAVTEKYQGFLITETPLTIEGANLAPGAYGMGFTKDGKFLVMDLGGNEVVNVAAKKDDAMAHPVPLALKGDADSTKLYAGRMWVGIKAQ